MSTDSNKKLNPLSDSKISTIELFGDELECFYQLGLKDQASANSSMKHINNLLSTSWDPVNKLASKLFAQVFDKFTIKDRHFQDLIDSYCQGANISSKDFIYSLLVPELCSFLSLWLPKISPVAFGCSSIFTLNKDSHPVHHRILDFPLKGTYDSNERAVITDYKDKLNVINFSTTGLPFSGLTSINEEGLSLAIHQKFTSNFDIHGESVFYIAHKLIHSCKNVDEALEFLKNSRSYTTWNFNLLDKEGNALEADLSGDELTYNLYDIHKEKSVYICNESLKESETQKFRAPLAMDFYNDFRKVSGNKISKKTVGKTNIQIIKEITSPVNSKKFTISPTTPASVASVLFSSHDEEILYIPNESPKVFCGEIGKLCFKDEFSHTIVKSKVKEKNIYYQEASAHLSLAQSYFDNNDFHETYHHLQMAQELYQDEKYKAICELFFLFVQYIHEPQKKVLLQIHREIPILYPMLPNYLQDTLKILDTRLSKLLSQKEIITSHKFSNPKLEVRNVEERRQNIVFHHTLRKLTFIHTDIFDIIFA